MIDNSKNNSIRFLGVSEETKKEILAEIERSAEPSTPVTIADIGSPEWKRLCSGGAVSENEPIVILYSDIAEVDPGLRDRFPYSALLDRQFPVPYILHAASMVSRLRERDSEFASFEHKLKMSENRLEVLLENLPFEFWACDEEGIVRYQNGISLTRFGNHVGERFRDFQSEEILHLDREENTARATLGETILSEEEYIVQGVYRSVHEVISPVVIEGRITGTMGLSIDTTEKSIVRKQLEHQEQFQEDLIRSSPFGIMIFNYSTKAISRINDTMTLLTGYTIEDIPDGASWWEKAFPDPVYRKEMLKEYRERYMPALFEGSRVEPHEARIRTKDGRYIWLQAHYARVGDLNVTFYSDVTDRKIAEFASEENRNQLSQFLEFLPDPAFAIDRSGTVTFWNRAMEELSECPASEILGKGNHEYARRFYGFDKPMLVDYALDPSRMDQHDYDYLQADGHVVFSEVKTILGCGKEYYLWARATPLFDAAGNAIGAIEIIRDISLRKENEQQLRESEEKFRTILETLPIGFFRTDLEGNFLEVNQEIFRIFGYPPDKAFLTGARQSPSFYQDHQQRERILRELAEGTETNQYRLVMKRLDGNMFPANMTIKLIRNASGKPVYLQGLIEDVSERERLFEAMVESEKFLTVAGLAAGMAHEINNPLGIIIQTLENLDRRLLGDLPANIAAAEKHGVSMEVIRAYAADRGIPSYITDISEAVTRAARIVTNMLQFSRKSGSQTGFSDVEGIIDRAIDLAYSDFSLKRRYDFKRIEIIRVRATLPAISCSETQLEQVIFNLLKNAAQAMAEKEYKSSSPSIRITTFLEERWAGIEIEDNGPGMDESSIQRIFEPFYTTKTAGEGTGLGLAISHYIIANIMNGNITVKSRKGEWSRFTIRLPLEPKEDIRESKHETVAHDHR